MQARPGSRRLAQRAEVTESFTLGQNKTFSEVYLATLTARA